MHNGNVSVVPAKAGTYGGVDSGLRRNDEEKLRCGGGIARGPLVGGNFGRLKTGLPDQVVPDQVVIDVCSSRLIEGLALDMT